MTITTSKQKKIITLAQQGLSIPEIAKETSTSYKTAKKYADISTTPQPQIPAPQQPVIDGRSPKFATPKPKRARDTTRSYASYENVPYYRPVRVAPPSGRGLDTVTDVKPLVPAKPLTKMQKEQKEFKNRKGIDVSWVKDENQRRHALNTKFQREEEREKKKSEYRINFAQNINEITRMMNERRKAKERENYEIDIASEQNGLTKEGIRKAINGAVEADKEEQEKMMNAYASLWQINHKEEIRLQKRNIDNKTIETLLPTGIKFLNDIFKSIVVLRNRPKSKPKIVKAQLVKKPMKARVIK